MKRQCRVSRGASIVTVMLLAALLAPGSTSQAQPNAAPATLPATAPAAVAPPQQDPAKDLLAHGNGEAFWLAKVFDAPGENPPLRTRIYQRDAGHDAWQHLSDLSTRVLQLSSYGPRLVVLLEGGDWQLLGADGSGTSGSPLPGNARLVALAGDAESLWALGSPPPESPRESAATAPATAPATRPAAVAPSGGLALYQMREGKWSVVPSGALPSKIVFDTPLSLALVDRVPWVAVKTAADTLEIYHFVTGGWQRVTETHAPAQPGSFKFLSGMSPATLWSCGAAGGRFEQFAPESGGERFASRVFPLKTLSAPPTQRTAADAISAVREMAIVDDKTVEQDYNELTLAPADKLAQLTLPVPAAQPFPGMFGLVLTVLMGLAILSSSNRRRGESQGDDDESSADLVLADLLRRLSAGLIDATPFLVPIILFAQFAPQAREAKLQENLPSAETAVLVSFVVALAIYLVHTALSELFTGRTLGKALLGLRVVSMDGSTPAPSSILIRNFLRVIDVALLGIPLAMITFSPLRQRIGDVAAGTIVIRDRVRPEGNLIDPPKEEQTAPTAPVIDAEPPAAGE